MRRRDEDADVWWVWRIGDWMVEEAEGRVFWKWVIRVL